MQEIELADKSLKLFLGLPLSRLEYVRQTPFLLRLAGLPETASIGIEIEP
jgi:hypothetical protein